MAGALFTERVIARTIAQCGLLLTEERLRARAPQAVRPAEIRAALQRDKGVLLAFTSIRHALGQLEARKAVEQDANGGWRIA